MRFTIYFFFAIFSSAINLISQFGVMRLLETSYAYFIALLTGTGAGWIVKYLLDKKIVFKHKARNNAHLAQNMATHAGAGVLTTLIFWSIETGFHFFVPAPGAMYIGAVLGLTVGYIVRYQIDRLVVFRP